jgi:hypothetical protein
VLGLYLANAGNPYGAVGSVVVFLLWVFYSAQILFMGAEFTQVYARRFGKGIKPDENAVVTDERAEAETGTESGTGMRRGQRPEDRIGSETQTGSSAARAAERAAQERAAQERAAQEHVAAGKKR